MDNVYISTPLSQVYYVRVQRFMIHSVMGSFRRDLLGCIAHYDITHREVLMRQRGALKVVPLKNDLDCDGFIVGFSCDQTSVYLLYNAYTNMI